MKKIFFLWNRLTSTFWFIPCVIILGAILLSMFLVHIDSITSFSEEGFAGSFIVKSSDSARSILVTIAAAMMGVAGTVFSVTLVALTLASSQFGSRLIKNFMYVRLNQVVLGAYISTYLYCLLVLNAIKDNDGYIFIPSISIMVAIFAAIANIILIIVFIHKIAISIQADKVISDISDYISKQFKNLYPHKMGQENEEGLTVDAENLKIIFTFNIVLKSPKSGYLQYVDGEKLIKLISKIGGVLHLHSRPGQYMVAGMDIATLYIHENIAQERLNKIVKQFVIGKTKMAQQDLEYSIHQMVEVAVRALSPGINDPFTAIACIDNLTSTLCTLVQIKLPSPYRYDEENKLRVIAEASDFEGVLDAAFNQIRQFSNGSPAVMIRLLEALTRINEFTRDEHYKKTIFKHAKMVLNLGEETIIEPNDLQDLQVRFKQVRSNF